MLSVTEENYLKALYKLSDGTHKAVNTNALADLLKSTPASVTDMIKKLHEKKLVDHVKYKGANLTQDGAKLALSIIRRHRIWEVFLVEKLQFTWDEIHEIAEELEHIDSDLLIERLDVFLGFPEIDPHGDPIPSADGHIRSIAAVPLTQITDFQHAWKVCAVTEDDTDFLRLLTRMGIALGTVLNIVEHHPFDDSYVVKMAPNATEILITSKVAHNLLLKKANR
jgi:DtxR family Mn-dependent transcriptional regulator